MKPEDVPDELLSLYGRNYLGASPKVAARRAMAAVLAAHERQVCERAEEAERRATEEHDRAVLAEAALRDHGSKLAAEMRYGQQQYDRAENAEERLRKAEQAEAAVERVREAIRDLAWEHATVPVHRIRAALEPPKETP